ncbi:PAS domain S-box protein [Leeuwenhoekiella aequorea]|uniref:histidine kinase n=1 Tax=Leeuwenhoekiella aequorea TaxID=283736 RepID=A0A4Q0P9G5_9FLAO|nr:PAS domain S-box protein [Leeuwenhoekiella aequorea]RXG23363.1 PAS domain S-box-containing protein [Leeuwenhoekiella aequorea]
MENFESYNKILIEQAPTAIAMLDKNMIYLAVSKKWITDYKLENQEIIGCSHYEVFPEISEEWKENHQKCLNGAIDICDGAEFVRADGTVQWIYWDVRPWYDSDKNVGGIIIHSGDITSLKKRDFEKERIEKVLEKTNEIARIGIWEVNVLTQEVFWSKVVYEIHEISESHKPNVESSIDFYKEGASRLAITNAVNNAINQGEAFDIEVEIITAKGLTVWARSIGQPEMVDGKCVRLSGMFQDIDTIKRSQIALNKANREMNAIFNSGSIAIITTDKRGIINHFNSAAELLLGYSASELVGKHSLEIFHIEDEIPKLKELLNSLQIGTGKSSATPKTSNFTDSREWIFKRKDGLSFPVQLTLNTIKDDTGNPIGILGVSFDITERKKAQDELLRKNQLLNFAEKITLMGNWQWDVVTNRLIWSDNMYKIFGVDKESELKIDSYFSFIHPEDFDKVNKSIKECLNGLDFNKVVHRIRLKDGTLKIIQLSAVTTKNQEGKVIELVGTCLDVTTNKMAENKFRGLLESAPDAMVIVNEKGKIQLINNQAEKLFGYTLDELFNKPVEILIPKRFTGNNAHIGLRNGFFAKPKVKAFGVGSGKDLYGINKEGIEIPIQISLSPLQTEEGLLVSAAIRDITTQKQASRKILEAKENLEVLANKLTAQNTQLADFVHITSHNLRAPVSNLNSLLEFYNTSDTDEEKDILFEKFEKVINHLTLTLNTLIEALKTKSETDKALEVISLESVLSKTQEILSGEIIQSNIQITSDFEALKKVSYNKVYLESIFLNLMSNAIKYRSKEKLPKLHIMSQIIDKKIILSFEDNGLGIDLMRNGNKLFGLNKVFHRHPEAKGVGLFMTKMQVEAMGGTIAAKSKVNEGTTFIINLN